MSPYTEDDILNALSEEGESMPDGVLGVERVPLSAEDIPATAPSKHRGGPGRHPAPSLQYDSSVPSGRLFNESDLSIGFRNIKTEKFEHRIIGYLKAQGYSNREIASQTGYHASYISQVIRLPWCRDLIIEEIRNSGREAVQSTLQASALDSVDFLIHTRDNEKIASRDRISAAKELLNRTFGMPTQPIVHEQKVDLDSLTDEALAKIAYRTGSGSN